MKIAPEERVAHTPTQMESRNIGELPMRKQAQADHHECLTTTSHTLQSSGGAPVRRAQPTFSDPAMANEVKTMQGLLDAIQGKHHGLSTSRPSIRPGTASVSPNAHPPLSTRSAGAHASVAQALTRPLTARLSTAVISPAATGVRQTLSGWANTTPVQGLHMSVPLDSSRANAQIMRRRLSLPVEKSAPGPARRRMSAAAHFADSSTNSTVSKSLLAGSFPSFRTGVDTQCSTTSHASKPQVISPSAPAGARPAKTAMARAVDRLRNPKVFPAALPSSRRNKNGLFRRQSVAEIFTEAREMERNLLGNDGAPDSNASLSTNPTPPNRPITSEEHLLAAAAAAAIQKIGAIKVGRCRSRSVSPAQRTGKAGIYYDSDSDEDSTWGITKIESNDGSLRPQRSPRFVQSADSQTSPRSPDPSRRKPFGRTPSNDDSALDDTRKLDQIALRNDEYRARRGAIRRALRGFKPAEDDWRSIDFFNTPHLKEGTEEHHQGRNKVQSAKAITHDKFNPFDIFKVETPVKELVPENPEEVPGWRLVRTIYGSQKVSLPPSLLSHRPTWVCSCLVVLLL